MGFVRELDSYLFIIIVVRFFLFKMYRVYCSVRKKCEEIILNFLS